MTEVDPAVTGVTAPMPWSSDASVAFVVVQESVDDAPASIAEGSAASVQVGAGGGGVMVTVTPAEQCTEPPGPVAVPV